MGVKTTCSHSLKRTIRQSSPAGVSPGLLALDLGCALPTSPPVLPDETELSWHWRRRSRQRRNVEGTEAVGRAQPRSRASSPGETPAGDDCQKTCAMPSSWETPAGDDFEKNLFRTSL